MLIRFAQKEDADSWLSLAKKISPVFGVEDMTRDGKFAVYIESKILKYEAIAAVDRMSGDPFGFIGFSKKHNRISWFAVDEAWRKKGAGEKLLRCAINQLDWGKDITVVTFAEDDLKGTAALSLYRKFGFYVADRNFTDEDGNIRCKMAYTAKDTKKAGSFHHRYERYKNWADEETCPVCLPQESDYPPVLIKELEYSWVECYMEAQGRLFGELHILSKTHSEHFCDMDDGDMHNFMDDVKKTAKALHEATGAVKINYEIHGNSMPHLHAHLFPRYLDDEFVGTSIDYNLYEPCPYESRGEFEWFVKRMRELIS